MAPRGDSESDGHPRCPSAPAQGDKRMKQEFLRALIQKASEEKKLTSVAVEHLRIWSTDRYIEFHDQLLSMIENEEFEKLNNSFYTILPFGTGGRRGSIGVGPNQINYRTIGESTQGVANYLSRMKGNNTPKKAVIAYDTRHYSKEFALRTAEVMVGNGFSVYIFKDFRSTPELSFAVRELQADVGFVISASHNPPTDNGIKVYWKDGGQIVPPHDQNIIEESIKVADIKRLALDEAQDKALIHWIGAEIDQKYWSAVCKESLTSQESGLHIVYTPLHGVGGTSVLPVLQRLGYHVDIVKDQEEPNGDFPNIPNNIPNPENPEALALAITKAKELRADIVLATDPDADRIGVAVPVCNAKKNWVSLTGNQIASLLTHFILEQLKQKEDFPRDGLVVKTAVTTDLVADICKNFGVSIKGNLLVGFKYIAEIIEKDPRRFIFGAEESHGALKGSYTRDKDAAISALLMAELTEYLNREGRTPYQLLDELYCTHGYYKDIAEFILLEGQEGKHQIDQMMAELRSHPPTEIGGLKIVEIHDYLQGDNRDLSSAESRPLEAPIGDILIFTLSQDGRTRVAIRPSGTEPKIKFYISVHSEVGNDLTRGKEITDALATAVARDIVQTAEAIIAEELSIRYKDLSEIMEAFAIPFNTELCCGGRREKCEEDFKGRGLRSLH